MKFNPNSGVNTLVLQEAVSKQFKDCMKAGQSIASLMQFLDQVLDVIPEIKALRIQYKNANKWFETALANCSKEKLAQHEWYREYTIKRKMGFHCACKNRQLSYLGRRTSGRSCVVCKQKFTLLYSDIYRKLLREQAIKPTPEAVLMYEAFDRLAKAYYLLFEAIRKVVVMLDFALNDKYTYYFEEIFFGVVPGEGKIIAELKQALQFLARGNFARDEKGQWVVSLAESKAYISLAMETAKWGYLSNQLQIEGVDPYYDDANAKLGELYSKINAKIRLANYSRKETANTPKETIQELLSDKKGRRKYYPYLVLPESFWQSGRLPKQYTLVAEPNPDFYPRVDGISFNQFFGPPGSGKTTAMSASMADGILNHNDFVFVILADKSNAPTLASIPMFEYDARTKGLVKRLLDMGQTPQGVPTLTLNFLQEDEKIKYPKGANPPTKWDRRVIVPNYRNFKFDFSWAMSELRKIAVQDYGYIKPKVAEKKWIPPSILNIRNLKRFDTVTKENADVQVSICMQPQFDDFRKDNPSVTAQLFCDELSALAPATPTSPDTYDSGTLLKETIKDTRRNNLTVEGGTQQITDVNTEVRNNPRNLLWRNLPKCSDKTKSQSDLVLSMLQVEDESTLPIVRELNDKGRLLKGYFWFMLNYQKIPRQIEVIKFNPPPFMINDPFKSNYEIFAEYQKHSGRNDILLDSWNDVPKVYMTENEFGAGNSEGPLFT
jgi:hypothetical protein